MNRSEQKITLKQEYTNIVFSTACVPQLSG